MTESMVDGIIGGYVAEVREYIPRMTRSVDKLRRKPESADALKRFHQMVHTIQGASLMIGLMGLSNIAQETEKVLDDLIHGRLPVNDAACDALTAVVTLLETYCDGLLGAGATPKTLVREAVLVFRRLRGEPPEQDDAALMPLLEGLPDQEGGGEEEVDVPPFEFQAPSPLTLPETLGTSEAAPSVPTVPKAGDMPQELVDSFFDEAREHLEDLDGDLNLLERQVTGPAEMTPAHKEIVRRIRRAVHTLKGSAAVVGFGNIAAWGHTLEDFLDFLYDHERTIAPDTIVLLMESADLLASIVSVPTDPRQDQVDQLSRRYGEIMKRSPEAAAPSPAAEIVEEADEPAGEEAFSELLSHKAQTLRVGTERVDELVNLIGELMIAASGLDQQMKLLTEALTEQEVFRARLREVARDMELGYEVKALGRLAGADAGTEFGDFDSLELDRYSKLNLIIRTLNESVIDIGAMNTRMWNLHSEMDGHLNRQRVLMSDLQNKMMRIRMLPMGTLSSKLRRTIREVAKKLGKKIRLSIVGEDIELDRLIWERITDPLMHLLRNAADHGIESPDLRKAAGKPEIGTIRIEATREGNQVVIRLSDDGAGLDYDTLRKKALKAGLLTDVADADDSELAALIFKPGFSTRDAISEVSGRGVGMDVVRENIQELKGTVQVASSKGLGVQFIIRIPLTLAALRALLFLAGGQTFAIALNDILEIQRVAPEQLMNGPKPAIRIGEAVMPRYSLRSILKKAPPDPEASREATTAPIVLIVRVGGKRRALEIEGLVGQREIFIKNTGSHLRYVKGVAGVTIMGDGSVVPILNLADLIDDSTGFSAEKEDVGPIRRERALRLMVIDDSVAIRQVVSRLIEDQGWEAVTAKDGVDALEKLTAVSPDLIFLDIEMPRMNGYELLSVLNQEQKYRTIPVVMLTSRATTKHREKAMALGAKGFMGKPFKNDEFVDMVLNMTDVIR